MKPSVQNPKTVFTKVLSKREEKKRINIRSGSGVRFQIGLIISLLLALVISESRIGSYTTMDKAKTGIVLDEPFTIGTIVIEPEQKPEVKVIAATKPVVRKPIAMVFDPDKITTTETPETGPAITLNEGPKTDAAPSEPTPGTDVPTEPSGPRNIHGIEYVPVFPGCEGFVTNKEKIACMSSKINAFITRNFNTDVADGESGERQRITVQFKIDSRGEITDVKARAPDRALEKEATRGLW